MNFNLDILYNIHNYLYIFEYYQINNEYLVYNIQTSKGLIYRNGYAFVFMENISKEEALNSSYIYTEKHYPLKKCKPFKLRKTEIDFLLVKNYKGQNHFRNYYLKTNLKK